MSAEDIVEDMDNLRHMLGAGIGTKPSQWGYRNRFITSEGHRALPSMHRLHSQGLVERAGIHYWCATQAGMRAIGFTENQIKKVMEP